MRRFLGLLVLAAVVRMLGGCAHPINISPDMAKITPADSAASKIDKTVGYHVSDQDRALKVTTPGGGGDRVEYTPYKDLDAGLYRVFSNTFASAYLVKDDKDRQFLTDKSISLVFMPTIKTTSSSRNAFFWPPTDFSVTIDCIAVDGAQQTVWATSVKADNDVVSVNATTKDFGLAGRSAAEKALKLLQAELRKAFATKP